MSRPTCKFCNKKISLFEEYEDYLNGFVHSNCKNKRVDELIQKQSEVKG